MNDAWNKFEMWKTDQLIGRRGVIVFDISTIKEVGISFQWKMATTKDFQIS